MNTMSNSPKLLAWHRAAGDGRCKGFHRCLSDTVGGRFRQVLPAPFVHEFHAIVPIVLNADMGWVIGTAGLPVSDLAPRLSDRQIVDPATSNKQTVDWNCSLILRHHTSQLELRVTSWLTQKLSHRQRPLRPSLDRRRSRPKSPPVLPLRQSSPLPLLAQRRRRSRRHWHPQPWMTQRPSHHRLLQPPRR